MEAGSTSEQQDDAVIIRNPTHCTAPITKDEMPNSPFLASLGFMSNIVLYRIRRPELDATARSPWEIRNLNERMLSTVQCFYRELLEQEAQIVLKFNCPNIAGAIAAEGLEKCKRQLAMDYCSKTLAETLSARYTEQLGPLDAAKAYKVVMGTLGGLDYLHTKERIMHGDLKSPNILVDDDFQTIKLCGHSSMSKTLTESGTFEGDSDSVGIGIWSAPEVLGNTANISAKTDIFAFGLVVFEMLSCIPPHTFPGISDNVISAPKELKELRNSTKQHDLDGKDDEDDEESFASSEPPLFPFPMRPKRVVFARKRQSPTMHAAPVALKKIKLVRMQNDEVNSITEVIDLVDEDDVSIKSKEFQLIGNEKKDLAEKENDPTVGEQKEKDGVVKENDSNGQGNATIVEKENATVEKQNAAVEKENATGEKENATVEKENATIEKLDTPVEKGNDTEQNNIVKPSNTVLPESENTNEQQSKTSESTEALPATPINPNPKETTDASPKVDSSTDPSPPSKATEIGPNAKEETPVEPSEVVMVFDSSDEESYTPMKSYEVDSSEYDTDEESFGVEEPDEYDRLKYGPPEEEEEVVSDDEEGSDLDGNFLNYGCLGTRPPLPSEPVLGQEYNRLLETFYVCTTKNEALRPSAAQLLLAYQAQT